MNYISYLILYISNYISYSENSESSKSVKWLRYSKRNESAWILLHWQASVMARLAVSYALFEHVNLLREKL